MSGDGVIIILIFSSHKLRRSYQICFLFWPNLYAKTGGETPQRQMIFQDEEKQRSLKNGIFCPVVAVYKTEQREDRSLFLL